MSEIRVGHAAEGGRKEESVLGSRTGSVCALKLDVAKNIARTSPGRPLTLDARDALRCLHSRLRSRFASVNSSGTLRVHTRLDKVRYRQTFHAKSTAFRARRAILCVCVCV